MMKLWKMFTKNHKGFSLVELICAVAILSIVITGAGSAMVISARSYQRGSAELDLQQQAQITANLLTNIIIDSDTIEEPALGTTATQLSVRKIETETVIDAEGNTSQVSVNYRYKVIPDSANSSLLYTREQVDADGNVVAGTTETNTLAEHIDTTAFSVTRVAENNIDFTLKVLGTDGRTFESDYHVTPRNGVSGSTGSALGGVKSIWVEPELILEPNQIYYLNVRITGTSIQGYTIADLTGNTSSETLVPAPADPGETIGANTVKIKVGRSETGSGTEGMFTFKVVPNDTEIASVDVKVYVRRVNDITVTGTRTSGSVNKAGGYYKVTASPQGTNMDKKLGAWYDADYVNPYQVGWSYVFAKEDELGNTTYPDYNEYIEIIGQGVERGIVDGAERDVPYVMFKLKQNMTSGCQLTVTATALHPEGVYPVGTDNKTNKMGLRYGKVSDATASVSAEWTLEYQAWKRNGKLDIAIHHLGDENFWIEEDGDIFYKWNAQVKFTAYDSHGNELPHLSASFDPWQREQHYPIKADIDLNNVRDKWDLTLTPYHDTNNVWDWGPSYSLPYVLAYYNDDSASIHDVNFYLHQNPYYVNTWGLEVLKYNIELSYQYLDEGGTLVTETISEDYEVEEVSVLYRNAVDVGCSWQRNNIIFVTTADTITDYRVHFQFDRGWDKDNHDYYFIDLKRFVGVVADRSGYINDIRRDITVTGQEKKEEVPDEDSVLTFTLTAEDKAECKALADQADGTITMIYEYCPFFGKLPRQAKTEDELRAENPGWTSYNFFASSEISADPGNLRWYKEYDMPINIGGVELTQAMMDEMKGCAGSVVFCFKEPNISGTTLKAMYCPTLAEYGPTYYIDDTSRFLIAAGAAQYQELEGGTWITRCNLLWNGSGWTAY